jgi:hypothetical protein
MRIAFERQNRGRAFLLAADRTSADLENGGLQQPQRNRADEAESSPKRGCLDELSGHFSPPFPAPCSALFSS